MKILLIIVFYLFFLSNLSATIIDNIEVNGNKRISKETIIVIGDIKIGTEFNDDVLNQTIKKLYDSNFFFDLDIYILNKKLIINVKENPIINSIKFTGIKNKSLIESLTTQINLKERTSFSEIRLKSDLDLLNNILKTSGYYFSKVEASKINNDELNSVELIFDIELNDKSKIKKIKFLGNKKIKENKLLSVIASEEHKFWKFLSNNVYLNQSIVDLDVRLLKNFYKNLGFYNANINSAFAEYDKNGFFELIFTIEAGEYYFFDNLNLTLPKDYNIKDFREINEILNSMKGERYSLEKLQSVLNKIEKIASERLYDFIDVGVEEKISKNNNIDLTFKINDSDKYYVERVNILGNFQTVESAIRNKFILDEGDPLNKLLLNKTIDNIKSLRIFKNVTTNVKDGSNENLKIIDLTVEEQPTGEITLAAGAGTNGVTIAGGINEKNFLGQAINLNTNIEISEETLKGYIRFIKPNFAYTDNSLSSSLESSTSDLLSVSGYKVKKTGFSIGTSFEQYENLTYSPELSFTFEDLETISSASSSIKKQEGKYEDLYFNYSFAYDKTNSRFEPTSGSKTFFYQELPFVSKNNEILNTFSYTKYKSLNMSDDMIAKASIYFKTINNFSDSDVRISKRAFIPYNRLRGFEKGKVGPIDNSDYIGGNYVYAANLSTTLPQILTTVENLDFSYFIDIANVWGVDYDSSLKKSNKIRSSTGLGLDILTPIGPLSLSYSIPISKSSTDKTENFRFNIGTNF